MRFRATINVDVVCANATPAAQYYEKAVKAPLTPDLPSLSECDDVN
jgi:hypothetical protein